MALYMFPYVSRVVDVAINSSLILLYPAPKLKRFGQILASTEWLRKCIVKAVGLADLNCKLSRVTLSGPECLN